MSFRQIRRDGFKNQHMIVLPEQMRISARKHPLLCRLHVTDAGYFPSAGGHFIERPKGAPTTLVILCMRGKGWVRIGNATREMRAGDLVWLPAGNTHAYGAAEQDPWSIAWAHFDGEECLFWWKLLLEATLSNNDIINLPTDRLYEIRLDQVYSALERGLAARHQVAAAAALRWSLSVITELVAERRHVSSARDRVDASVEILKRDWQRPHRLD